MQKIRIGLGQINTKDDIEKNLETIQAITEQCAVEGANIVIFPECSTYLSDENMIEHAESLDGNIINTLKKIAQKNNVYIHNGSFLEKNEFDEKVYNTSVLINPTGEIEAIYRKIHLFDVEIPGVVNEKESDVVKNGHEAVNTINEMGNFGFSICYDLRFPELFRRLTEKGAKLIFVPAAFTLYTGKDHWEVLLRSRAIENQVYIVGVNQFGERPIGKSSYGNSMVVDPWGVVIARAQEKVGYLIADVDMTYLENTRKTLPCLTHKRDFI
ncbi:carbon-nitrogen hydrolase family protein [Fusibacter ferrireducens]|uniref:Carbon-nitrogen hydrolase family protein n=1 Tax=Fusibacter ferrireducens TaxID=2785058 RepID=A0ABR9ZX40_9FIRM|nr:carbon-nitrogen hydrolase family protein [Fusibacter ferrireducens]MBF4695034.1 carbon-nitrogen hydrolase family protein [Fusibacter ferrireducens]